jgi:tetratricopeptide (TPR) repeat protein
MTRKAIFFLILSGFAPLTGFPQGPVIEDSADETVRPFDTIFLKNGNKMVGLVDGDYDAPEINLLMSGGKTKVKVPRDDIAKIIRRQTPDELYVKKLKLLTGERDPAARAKKEFELGRWCKSPLPELDGAPPRPKNALRHFFTAVELSPSFTEAYPHLFSSLTQRSSEGGGDGATDLESEVKAALLAEKGGYSDPEVDYRLGRLLAEEMQLPEKAQAFLERVLQKERKNQGHLRQSRTLLTAIYRQLGAPEKAIAMYEAIITSPESSPANFEPYYELGRLHARSGKPDELKAARELFSKAQAIQPEYLPIQAELAALDYRQGDLLQAEKKLKALLAKEPENVPRAIDLALVRTRLGRLGPTEKVLNGFLAKAEGEDQARASLALAGLKADRNEGTAAAELCRKALEKAPDLIEAKVFLASQLILLAKIDEARKIAQDLLAGGSGNRWLFAGGCRILGEAELAEGHPDAAFAYFQRAAEVDAQDAPLLERLGVLLMRQGKLDLGYDYLKRARQLGGERPDTLNALAYYHYMRGELQESKKLLTQVVGLVKAPPKAQGQAKPVPVPPARAYALSGLDLIADIERLEVWTADLKGPDGPTLNGWEEVERFGIEVKRQDSKIVLAGKQANVADGVTLAMLDRPVDVSSFERLAMRARVDSGKVRLALRLEGVSSRGGASAGLIFYRDFDGTLRPQVKTTLGDWETVAPTENETLEGGKLVFKGTARWPEDKGTHLLEIRRAGARGTAQGAGAFDLYFDGDPVAKNVKVSGLGGRQYQVGFSGQTDAVGNDYSVSVESFRIYRERPVVRAKVVR